MGGIAAAQGQFIIMGDADGSYDFSEIPTFVEKLRQGYDLVQGCRLPTGGGTIMPGAMPRLHRWIGNPAFSLIANNWFNSRFTTYTADYAVLLNSITSASARSVPEWNSLPK